jgi:hypothetical protein
MRLDTSRNVTSFDTTILNILGDWVIPRRIGKTQAVVRLPSGADTISLEVVREDWGLAVYKQTKK